MNKHIMKIRNIVLEYQNSIEAQEIEKGLLKEKYQSGKIARVDYESKLNEIEERISSQSGVIGAVEKVGQEYQANLEQWATLNSDDLTGDLKLFDSPIQLEVEEYKALEEKNQSNYTMLRAIKDYTEKNDIHYSKAYSADKEEKLKTFNEFATVATNIISTIRLNGQKNYMGTVWGYDEKFNNLYADTSQLIKTNE